MIKKFGKYNEGKIEQQKIDDLLDKGVKNLTQKEKDLIVRLSHGGLLKEEPKNYSDATGLRGNIKKSGDKDFLNNMLGTNIGSDTQFYQVMPDDTPFEGPNDTKKSKFKDGDKITYRKSGSDKNGMNATFLKVREDGKYSIRFDDGSRLAANPKNVYPIGNKKLDPYGEEAWYGEDQNNAYYGDR